MVEQYIPIFIVLGFAIMFALATVFSSNLFGPFRPTKTKLMPYESGKDPVGSTSERVSVKYYLVAMMFIIFDIEVIYVFPWGVEFKQMYADYGIFAFLPMLIFLIVLELGFLYLYKKGGLKWD